jgi:hypothetical protein
MYALSPSCGLRASCSLVDNLFWRLANFRQGWPSFSAHEATSRARTYDGTPRDERRVAKRPNAARRRRPETWPRCSACGRVRSIVPPRLAASFVFAALLALSSGAWPGPSSSSPPLSGRSIGSPTDGRLVGGTRLQESQVLHVCPLYAGADVRWGLQPLVSLVDRAAHAVRREYPDAVLNVGHLSRAGGGEISHHRSHESGRDVDILFYIRGVAGKPLLAPHFVAFRADGTAPTWPGAFFDDARNWALVASLVTDSKARVAHIFVASPLRARLLAFAEKIGAPGVVRLRAAEVMTQPHASLPHDDHFHIRIACPPGMLGCVEYPTLARVHARGRGIPAGARLRGRDRTRPEPSPSRVAHAFSRSLVTESKVDSFSSNESAGLIGAAVADDLDDAEAAHRSLHEASRFRSPEAP